MCLPPTHIITAGGNMISQFYKEMTGKESVIRKFFDYSRQRAAELGPDSVYNFSIGNPSVPVPEVRRCHDRTS